MIEIELKGRSWLLWGLGSLVFPPLAVWWILGRNNGPKAALVDPHGEWHVATWKETFGWKRGTKMVAMKDVRRIKVSRDRIKCKTNILLGFWIDNVKHPEDSAALIRSKMEVV